MGDQTQKSSKISTLNPQASNKAGGRVGRQSVGFVYDNLGDKIMTQAGVDITISLTVTRRIGGTEVTLGASRSVTVANENQRRAHYDKLALMLNDQFDHFIKERVIVADEVNNSPAATDAEIIPADELVVEIKAGKKYYAIKGGRYTAHGVRVWREVLEPTGLLDELGDKLSLTLFAWSAQVERKNGSLKVVKLWEAAKQR